MTGLSAGLAAALLVEQDGIAKAPADCIDAVGRQLHFTAIAQTRLTTAGTRGYACPRQGSPVMYVYPVPTDVRYAGFVTNGDSIVGNAIWWRTSGPIGCWISDTVL